MATPLVTGLAVAATALAARAVVTTVEAWALAGPRARAFYHGGFEAPMTRREAALILGVREGAATAARARRAPARDDGEPSRRGRVGVPEHEDQRGQGDAAARTRARRERRGDVARTSARRATTRGARV